MRIDVLHPTRGWLLRWSLLAGLLTGMAYMIPGFGAEPGKSVLLPMVFHSEARVFWTSASMEVTENTHKPERWWEDANRAATPGEASFRAVVQALKNKDRKGFAERCDAQEGRDPARFEDQATALMSQLEKLEFSDIPRSLEFDDFACFCVGLRRGERVMNAPFLFRVRPGGQYGYLPYRSEALSYQLVADWLNAMGRTTSLGQPVYSDPEIKRRATHAFDILSGGRDKPQATPPLRLYLRGAPIDTRGDLSDLAQRVTNVVGVMIKALSANDMETFSKCLTTEGASQARKWYAGVEESDRAVYRESIALQKPFFLFDAKPLVIVYTRTPRSARGIEVMYFLVPDKGDLIWANSSHVTLTDQVFKRGPLYEAAFSQRPFSKFEIQ